LFLWKWNDLPPARFIRQARRAGCRRCRDLVMGKGHSETKLQHLAAFSGGRGAFAVTGLTIHDNVMRKAIPAAGLLQ
jgi:hypothetical protein